MTIIPTAPADGPTASRASAGDGLADMLEEVSSREFEKDPEEAGAQTDADPLLELTEEDELFLRPLSKTSEPGLTWCLLTNAKKLSSSYTTAWGDDLVRLVVKHSCLTGWGFLPHGVKPYAVKRDEEYLEKLHQESLRMEQEMEEAGDVEDSPAPEEAEEEEVLVEETAQSAT